MIKTHQFFDFGKVTIISYDNYSRQIALDTCIPCSLLLAIDNVILKHSVIDNYKIRNPLAAWTPKLDAIRFKSEHRHATFEINEVIRNKILRLLTVLTNLTSVLNDPADITPMLPLGTYVEFRMRCKIDSMLDMIKEMEKMNNIAGISEFKYAMAESLALVLHEMGDVKE
jgi:hypothetical protein